jgi:CO/xanthine dehydrogenase Mo-binding subunit
LELVYYLAFNQAGALVHIYFNDGSVHINTGAIEMGQGTYTKIAQLAAHALGLPFNKIKVSATRTDIKFLIQVLALLQAQQILMELLHLMQFLK